MAPLRKIDSLMLREFIPLLLVGILTFGVLMTSFTLLKDALKFYTEYRLPLSTILVFFMYGIPQILAYTFPMAILLASLLTFGRMSGAGEITALRASGINFIRIITPILVAAFFVTCLTFLLNELYAPRSTLAAFNYIKGALTEVGISLSEKNIAFLDQDGQWLFGAEDSEGNDFHGVKLVDYRNPKNIIVYVSHNATWDKNTWIFKDVRVFHLGEDGERFFKSSFDELSIDLNRTPTELLQEGRNPEELSLKELRKYISSVKEKADQTKEAILKLEAKYFLKIATPFSCLLFPLIAAPLGMNPQRGSSTVGMGLSMILVFVYYLLTTLAINITQNGVLPPSVSAWLPNFAFLLVGIYLNGLYYWKAGR